MIHLRHAFFALGAAVWLAQGPATQASGKELVPAATIAARAADSSLVLTVNPYSNVAWTTTGQFKANLHTHTTNSDGSYPPAEVIDRYKAAGYAALAITDHDRATWPWSAYGRDPQQAGLVAIAGNELSKHHHVLSLFTAYEPVAYDLENALANIGNQGGLAAVCHPSFHWSAIFSVPGARNPMTDSVRQIARGDFTIEARFRTTQAGRGILMGNYSYELPVALNLELLPDNQVRVLLIPPAGQGATADLRSRLANDWGIDTRDGQWHHLAATRIGDVLSLYLDGRFMKLATSVTQSFDLQGAFFYLGRDNRTQGLELDGDLDWPRLWNRGLSSNEVFSLWQRALPGQAGGPSRDGLVFEFDSQAAPIPPEVLNHYAGQFTRHPHLFGVEIVNPASDFSLDRKLWDLLLARLMPQRPVWGLANDDMHHEVQLGVGWSVLLAPQLDEAVAKQALRNGAYYFSTVRGGSGSAPDRTQTPTVDEIAHDPAAGQLRIRASVAGVPLPENAYAWIADGQTVLVGSRLDYRKVAGIANYVRAEIQGPGGKTFTNPFGFRSYLAPDSQQWSLSPGAGSSRVVLSALPGNAPTGIVVLGATAFHAESNAFDFRRLQQGTDYAVSGKTVIIQHDPGVAYQFYRLGATAE